VIPENACNVILAEGLCNLLPLFIGESNTAVVIIYT
jgi:hypothetical protein